MRLPCGHMQGCRLQGRLALGPIAAGAGSLTIEPIHDRSARQRRF
ncbi:MAG: hypothetical protein ACRD3N_18235 [Terracidiphilus sp.]